MPEHMICSVEFQKAAKPLAEFLAKLPCQDPIHKYVLADIYDMVNDIRDEYIARAEDVILTIQSEDNFYSDREKRAKVLRLQRAIRQLQGRAA